MAGRFSMILGLGNFAAEGAYPLLSEAEVDVGVERRQDSGLRKVRLISCSLMMGLLDNDPK